MPPSRNILSADYSDRLLGRPLEKRLIVWVPAKLWDIS
jgi:hypothetical protein